MQLSYIMSGHWGHVWTIVLHERIHPSLEQDIGIEFVGSGEQGDAAGVDHDVGDEGG